MDLKREFNSNVSIDYLISRKKMNSSLETIESIRRRLIAGSGGRILSFNGNPKSPTAEMVER